MEESMYSSPRSLKVCCLYEIRRNEWLDRNESLLNNVPLPLLLELCEYVSLYGLSFLDAKVTQLGYNGDYLYLKYMKSLSLGEWKVTYHIKDMIPPVENSITVKQFFFNQLLKELIDKIAYPINMGLYEAFEQVCYIFLKYPRNHDGESKLDIIKPYFILSDVISSYATSLTLNPYAAIAIVNNFSYFSSILQSVECINIDDYYCDQIQLAMKAIDVIITTALNYNLSAIYLESRDVYSNITNDIFHLLSSFYVKGSENIDNDNDGTSDKMQCIVLKDRVSSNQPASQIVYMKVIDFSFGYHGPVRDLIHCFDTISSWVYLQKLCISGDFLEIEDTVLSKALLALRSYNNLKDLTLSPTRGEIGVETSNVLKELARPACEMHETRKCLHRLCIGVCKFSFFISLLQLTSAGNCVDDTSRCAIEELKSLVVDVSLRDNESIPHNLHKNDTLRELQITTHYYEERGDDSNHWIDFVAGMAVHTFSLSSHSYIIPGAPPRSLGNLLRNTELEHLRLELICNSEKFFDDEDDGNSFKSILRSSKLTTLVWTYNGLGNIGLLQIGDLLPHMPLLKFLDLSDNDYDIDGVCSFLQSVHRHKHYFNILILGHSVCMEDIKAAGMQWILDKYTKISAILPI